MTYRRVAIVSLDFVGLATMLFDKDTKILNARPSFNNWGDSTVEVVLEHPSFTVIETGRILPRKVVIVTQHEDGSKSIKFEDAA